MEIRKNRLQPVLGPAALGLLLLGCLFVIRPFISALLWAVVLTFSTWPVYARLERWLGQRRTLAALIMMLAMALLVLLPFVVVGFSLADNVKDLSAATLKWLDAGPPAAPAWLERIPVVGAQAHTYWNDLAHDSSKLTAAAKKLIQPISDLLLGGGVLLGRGVVELALSVLIAFFLFRDGVALATALTTAVGRIAGERGGHLLQVAGGTVRGVVYGMIGTALLQALMTGAGFLVAGVPGATVLALVTFLLCVITLGPWLVWIPAAIWLFNEGATGWGIFMVVWGLAISSVDNFLKPYLISQGSAMPFVLVFFGVLGGALAFGFIGVFLGPTLLAVGYRLAVEWVAARQQEPKE
jgi:predicted PurR-regulated permease PerM